MSEKSKILIVDDEYAFCKALRKYLEKIGYEVLVATDGDHALDLIAEAAPDLMTLDIRMPGTNGYEVLNKAKHLAPATKIVVLTAVGVPSMEEKLEHSGAHAVLRKPVNLEQLRETVAGLLA